MFWNDERIATLKKLWAAGWSEQRVADHLGTTRGAVAGKLHRLDTAPRSNQQKRRGPAKGAFGFKTSQNDIARDAEVKKPKLKTEPFPEYRPEDVATKTFDEITDDCCKFRIDKPFKGEPYGFCGKDSLPGLRWCEQHLKRVAHPGHAPVVLRKIKTKEKAKEAEPA